MDTPLCVALIDLGNHRPRIETVTQLGFYLPEIGDAAPIGLIGSRQILPIMRTAFPTRVIRCRPMPELNVFV